MASPAIQQHNSTVFDSLEKGDLVEFKRIGYSHWAVYYGERKVIHLTGTSDDLKANVNSGSAFTISGDRFRKASVKVDDFWAVVRGSKVKKNNDKDRMMRPFTPDKIIERAMNKVGEIDYHVLWSNCEHFASYCRYGISESDQANKFLIWSSVCTSAAENLAENLPEILVITLGSSSKVGKFLTLAAVGMLAAGILAMEVLQINRKQKHTLHEV